MQVFSTVNTQVNTMGKKNYTVYVDEDKVDRILERYDVDTFGEFVRMQLDGQDIDPADDFGYIKRHEFDRLKDRVAALENLAPGNGIQ